MKSVFIEGEEFRIYPQTFAAIIKAEQVQREAGLPEGKLESGDIILALRRDPDILHKLAAVYFLNDAERLKNWGELWREWADKYSALQMLPIIEAAVSMTREGAKIETLNKAATIEALTKRIQNKKAN